MEEALERFEKEITTITLLRKVTFSWQGSASRWKTAKGASAIWPDQEPGWRKPTAQFPHGHHLPEDGKHREAIELLGEVFGKPPP